MLDADDRDGCAGSWAEITSMGVSGVKTVTMKVNYYPNLQGKPDPCRFWQLRNSLEDIGYKNAEGVYKIVKTHVDSWKQLARTSGLLWSCNFRPSRKSAVSLKTPLTKCSPRFETSTALLLVLLTKASTPGTSKARSDAASNFFQAFLKRAIVCNRAADKAACETVQDDALGMCDKNVSNGKCEHMNDICGVLELSRKHSVDFRILKALIALSSYVSDIN